MVAMSTLASQIKTYATHLGFDAVGIARVPLPEHESTAPLAPTTATHGNMPLPTRLRNWLMQWLEQGFHGTMAWMARTPERRSDPAKVLPGCRSMMMVGMNYYTGHDPDESGVAGRIARYAWGKDYHEVMNARLLELEKFLHKLIPDIQTRSYVDTGPIMEKAWAQEAGIGWIGKHTNLVSTNYGSWLLLGEILTTVELQPDEPGTDLCGSCSLCIQACPTQAIVEPYRVDAERCISYLTIEYRGALDEIPAELRKKMGNRIFGCDDCLDICPFNVHAQTTHEPAFQPSAWTLRPELPKLTLLTPEDFRTLTKSSPIRRPKYEGFQRNVAIAISNQSSPPSSTAIQ